MHAITLEPYQPEQGNVLSEDILQQQNKVKPNAQQQSKVKPDAMPCIDTDLQLL